MFTVNDTDAAAIRAIYERDGEISAAIEVRRRYRGITDNTNARRVARTIAGWVPPPRPAATVTKLQPRR